MPPKLQSAESPWCVHFFQRHKADDPAETIPAREFLFRCPTPVQAKLVAIIKAVADAPPPAFSGGGKWEAKHGDLNGFYEARADGANREHNTLFCMRDRHGADVGVGGPSLVLITGASKPFKTALSKNDYKKIRALGDEFLSRNPRSVAK